MPPRKKLSSKERWEQRKKKRREIEQCYREHTPPQVRYLRLLRRLARLNPNPVDYSD